MADKNKEYLKLKNGDKIHFIPPSPSGNDLGGVSVAEKTTWNSKVETYSATATLDATTLEVTFDKTYAEIKAAYDAGKLVTTNFVYSTVTTKLNLTNVFNNTLYFDGIYQSTDRSILTIRLTSADEVTYDILAVQSKLSSSNQLNPAYIATTSSYRFVTDTEKTTWNSKQSAITDSTDITITDNELFLNKDNQTIVYDSTNEVIKTAIGGYISSEEITIVDGEFTVFSAQDPGIWLRTADDLSPFEDSPSSVTVYLEGSYTLTSTGETVNIASDFTFTKDFSSLEGVYGCWLTENEISFEIYPSTYSIDPSKAGKAEVKGPSMSAVTFLASSGSSEVYNPIDGRFIPIDNDSITLNSDGELHSDIPTELSELTDDSTHRVVTDTQINTWNNKQSTLTAGTNITISNNTISAAVGGGDIVQDGSGLKVTQGVSAEIVTSWESTPVDTKVPSEKLVYDTITTYNTNHNLTITCTADDNTSVTNQTIRIYNNNSGEIYKVITYNGQSVTIEVPNNFEYKIVPVCTLSMHYTVGKPTGTVTQDTSLSITYYLFDSNTVISTFPQAQGVIDAGLGRYVTIGTQISYTDSDLGEMIYDIVNFDTDNEIFTVCKHDALSTLYQYDCPEATFGGFLSVGNYYFNNGSTMYYFTITVAIPVGGQVVVDSNYSTFSTYESGYSITPLETGSVSTSSISGATYIGATGSGRINHSDRLESGSNNYGESNIRKWLNGIDNKWWRPSTIFDRPSSYAFDNGFMHGIPKEVLDCIATTEVRCYATATYEPITTKYPKNLRYTLYDKFFLLSTKEVTNTAIYVDGSCFFYNFFSADLSNRIKYRDGSTTYWWVRDPYSNQSCARFIDPSGSAGEPDAKYTSGVVPACTIAKSV